LSKSGWSVSPTTATAIAIVALIIALAGFAVPLIAPYNASSDQMVSVQSQVSELQKQVNSLPVVNQRPTHRIIRLEWVNTGNGGQDRFNPNFITINQGDTVDLTFFDNDTDGHTFEVLLPTGLFVLNNTFKGQINHLTMDIFSGDATGCKVDGTNVPCNLTGGCNSDISACNVTSSGSFKVTVPGVYRFFCLYHQTLGMYGFLVVLPNKGYIPPTSVTTTTGDAIRIFVVRYDW
jgi:plastocyanin